MALDQPPIAQHEIEVGPLPFGDDYEDGYLFAVWLKLITTDNLSLDYHTRTALTLMQAVENGYGGGNWATFSPEAITYEGLRRNIYVFSAAKQYQQVRSLSAFINQLGEAAQYNEFKKLAQGVFQNYNENYLRTEFRTAVRQSQAARDWLQIEADQEVFPLLQYNTQNDPLVRPEHQDLEGTVKPVNDSFWSYYYPPNGWNCRCFTSRLQEGQADVSPDPEPNLDDYPELFRMNAGKDKMVFNPAKHPYFKIAKGDGPLKRANFNLPVPE